MTSIIEYKVMEPCLFLISISTPLQMQCPIKDNILGFCSSLCKMNFNTGILGGPNTTCNFIKFCPCPCLTTDDPWPSMGGKRPSCTMPILLATPTLRTPVPVSHYLQTQLMLESASCSSAAVLFVILLLNKSKMIGH